MAASPYAVDDPTRVVVAFLGEEVGLGDLALGDLSDYLPDELTRQRIAQRLHRRRLLSHGNPQVEA